VTGKKVVFSMRGKEDLKKISNAQTLKKRKLIGKSRDRKGGRKFRRDGGRIWKKKSGSATGRVQRKSVEETPPKGGIVGKRTAQAGGENFDSWRKGKSRALRKGGTATKTVTSQEREGSRAALTKRVGKRKKKNPLEESFRTHQLVATSSFVGGRAVEGKNPGEKSQLRRKKKPDQKKKKKGPQDQFT